MCKTTMAVLALALAVACGKGDRREAAADSLSRDLQLAPADSGRALNDRPAGEAASPSRSTTSGARARPAPARGAEAPAGASLEAGTTILARLTDSISSRRNKVGDVIRAKVTRDIRDRRGRVVVPAGSVLSLTITAIHESENKSDKTGTLTLAASELSVNGRSHPIDASIDSVGTQLQGRPTNAGDIAKVGAGTAIGAVVGRVIGGSTKGAVIGGVLGGAVGAQRAVETKDRDVVVPAGSTIKLTLRERLTV